MSELHGREKSGTLELQHFTALDHRLEASLLSFFAELGKIDVYWRQVRPTFKPGPWFIVAATSKSGGTSAVDFPLFQSLVHCWAFDGDTAIMSQVFVTGSHLSNQGLMAAVYKEALEGLRERGMANVRYLVRTHAHLLRRLLLDTGFARVSAPEHAGHHIEAFEAPIDRLLAELGLGSTSTHQLLGSTFGTTPAFDRLAYFQSLLQLAALSQPPTVGGTLVQMGGLGTALRESEPGQPPTEPDIVYGMSEPGQPPTEPN